MGYVHADNFRVYVTPKRTNYDKACIFHMARSLADRTGIEGIHSKRYQGDRAALRNGEVKLVFKTRRAAMKAQALIDENLGHVANTRRTRVRDDD